MLTRYTQQFPKTEPEENNLANQGSDLIEPFLTRYGTFHMPFWDAVHRGVLRPDAVRAALQGLKLGSATATSRVAQWGGSLATSWPKINSHSRDKISPCIF